MINNSIFYNTKRIKKEFCSFEKIRTNSETFYNFILYIIYMLTFYIIVYLLKKSNKKIMFFVTFFKININNNCLFSYYLVNILSIVDF